MANMSYCRFHNTRLDIDDCINALERGEGLSDDEARACKMMFKAILFYLDDEEIVEEINWDRFDEWAEEVQSGDEF